MKRHLWGLALAGVLIGLAGCAKDPTASISGTPTRIVPQYSKLFLFPGDSVAVTVAVRDEQGTTMAIPATITSDDETIVSVRGEDQPPQAVTRFWARAEGVGGTKIEATAEGLTNSILVSVFPAVFEGDISVISSAILDTVVIDVGTSGLVFIPGTSTVSIDGGPARIVAESATQIKALALTVDAVAAATVTVTDMIFLEGTEYESTIAELDAASPIALTGEDNEPENNNSATATPITVGGAGVEGLLAPSDARDWLTFTLATDRSVDILMTFDGTGGSPDLDAYLRNAALSSVGGCSMGTGSQPEECTTSVLPAGTYFIRLDFYDSGSATPPHWYRVTVN